MTSSTQPNMDPFFEPRIEGESALASVRGEIDLHNSPDLRLKLLGLISQSKAKKLILDLSRVTYMDSSAVAVLVEALQNLRRRGGKVILTALQPRVRSLLEIARLDTLFVLAANEAEALAK